MIVRDFQSLSSQIIDRADAKIGAKHDVATTIFHLMEELGEVASEIYKERISRGRPDPARFGGELAEAFMLFAHLATQYGIDLEASIEQKLEETKKRFDISDLD